jgi:hypothetical protein
MYRLRHAASAASPPTGSGPELVEGRRTGLAGYIREYSQKREYRTGNSALAGRRITAAAHEIVVWYLKYRGRRADNAHATASDVRWLTIFSSR